MVDGLRWSVASELDRLRCSRTLCKNGKGIDIAIGLMERHPPVVAG